MTTTANVQTNRSRFQTLLRELFQFDCADLDFGIYRIMNRKRDTVERFVSEHLPVSIATALDSGPLAQQAQSEANLQDIAQRVRAALGESAIDDNGVLAENYHQLPIGQEYLEARRRVADGTRSRESVEVAIYNHLYTFFSRYYDSGDFISKRRYSRNQRYAIPYNGEEVYLHWANSDQYYVKTDEHFRNYDWKAPNGVTVRFRLRNADVEQNNVKGDRRYFIPCFSETEWDAEGNVVTIHFEYRPLSGGETAAYGKSKQQEAIVKEAISAIPAHLHDTQAIAALTGEYRYNDNGSVSRLEHHLYRYVRRNNSDFFIHKNLAGFLNRELDFYLKNEVLQLDNLAVAGQEMAEGWFQQMRLTKVVGSKIIDFLAQIEDFQKMLWEKRKFITETQYCITLGNIDPVFYPDIVANDGQWDEWQILLNINTADRSVSFLESQPTLPLDTLHFDIEFTDRLLASFDDLDGITNGLLIHSENWQALNLLITHHHEDVQCIYIDPPFNTGADGFLYKDGYPHSNWLAMMESCIQMLRRLLAGNGTFYAHIDYNEKERLKLLLDKYLSYVTEIIWRIGWVSGYKSGANKFIRNHDTIYQYGKTEAPLFIKTYIPYPEGYTRRDGSPPSGKGYPLEDTWNCSDLDSLNSIQIMSFSHEKVGNQALTQKNEQLIGRMIESSTRSQDLVLDCFLGSGTTTATAHKMGRRYIGIEMGEQFQTYVLPRMKRVLFGDQYGISSAHNWKGGGAFKYFRLESYEDALNNIEFDQHTDQLRLLEPSEEYLLKYMLSWETRDSDTLLNPVKLARPFSYRLWVYTNGEKREQKVDLAETFNYLLGLKVRKREVLDDDGRIYLVYRGETPGGTSRQVVVIWRETEGWASADFARDRDFVAEHNLRGNAETVYVNGDSAIPGAKPIEPMFKDRMFSGVNA